MNVASLKAQEVRAKRDYRLAPKVEGGSPASDKAETGVAKAPQNTLEELESTALTYRKIYENYVQAHTESGPASVLPDCQCAGDFQGHAAPNQEQS